MPFARAWVRLFRATPLLVLLLWADDGPSVVAALSLGPFAARGLTRRPTPRRVIPPPALRRVVPMLGNQLVDLVEISALVSVVELTERTRKANERVATLHRPAAIARVLARAYLVLILAPSWPVRCLEACLAAPDPTKR